MNIKSAPGEHLTIIFFEGLYSQKNKASKNFKIKSKENKISHGRGNSLRNKVRSWMDLDSSNPLKPHPIC